MLFIAAILVLSVGLYFGKYGSTNKDIPAKTQQEQAVDETVNWKTYTDKTFNFSFKYPSNWKIDKIPDDTLGWYINFFEEGVTQMPTTNMHTRGNEVFRIMLYGDETGFDSLKEVKPIPPASITVSGKPALRSEGQIDILVKNKVLHLEIISTESKKYTDQILSTFKFTQ